MVFSESSRRHCLAVVPRVANALVATVIAGAAPALAQKAHVHGEAVLEVSLTGSSLAVVLRGPAQVFFGFEHPPTDDEETRIVQAAVRALQSPGTTVLELPGSCVLDSVDVNTPFPARVASGARSSDDTHHEHREDDAGAQHDDGGAPEHGRHHVGHADVEVAYGFSCAAGAPARLTLTAFETFPALERVEAAWISDSAAGSAELSRREPQVYFEAP